MPTPPKRPMPARSNKGGAVRGQARAAQVKAMNATHQAAHEPGVANKNFISGAIKHPGALHKMMGVPMDQKIPAGRMAAAAKAKGKLGQRARLAQTLKKLSHK